MEEALKDFLYSARILTDNWDNEDPSVANYPSYMPSFDEFVEDIALMVRRGRG